MCDYSPGPEIEMENAELYSKYNSMQREGTVRVLDEFVPQLSWVSAERVLDIGCGPGDVTAEVLLPHLPPEATLVGLDMSSKMIEHADKKYSNRRTVFKNLDFSTKDITNVFQEQSFTKVFSFYCIHWIQDQKQAAKNIFELLCPGGEFLIIISPSNSVFTVYKILIQMDKWKSYMKDVDTYIPRFHGSPDPCSDIRRIFTAQGLDVMTCEERMEDVTYLNLQSLVLSLEAVNPFVNGMDLDTRKQYMACLQQVLEDNKLFTETSSGKVVIQNPLLVVYGRRPEHNSGTI